MSLKSFGPETVPYVHRGAALCQVPDFYLYLTFTFTWERTDRHTDTTNLPWVDVNIVYFFSHGVAYATYLTPLMRPP